MNKTERRPTYLFVVPWSLTHQGGVNQVVINLARQMIRGGKYEPIVLVTDWNAVDPVWEQVHGLRIVRWRIRYDEPSGRPTARLAYLAWALRFRSRFRSFCEQNGVAVINAHFPGQAMFSVARAIDGMTPRVPLLISFHGADISLIEDSPQVLFDKWQRFLSRCDGIVVCSEALKVRVAKAFGKALPVHAVHNGLDAPSFVSQADGKLPKQIGERFVLSVAKFEEKKGLDVLVHAFAAIAKPFPELELVLVGATAEMLQPLRELCCQKGLEGRVHFFPDTPHSEVAEFFRRATVFVLPSRQEPFGIVLLEAGAFGLPVIASRVGGIPEVLTDGITGRLVAPDDANELAACIRSVLTDRASAADMGERFRRHVVSNFSWTTAYEKYIDLSAQLLELDPGRQTRPSTKALVAVSDA